MKVGLISDTHGKLRPQVLEIFDGVDVILHAGDIGDADIITELAALAPVHAVHGNTDDYEIHATFRNEVRVELEGVKFVVVHGHLLRSTAPAELRAAFPDCDVVVYGHTHVPFIDDSAKPLVINPGAAGPARFKLKPSVATMDLPGLSVQFANIA